MKKKDLKNLALMGITGGMLMAQSTVLADTNASSRNYLAARGCGGAQGCGGASGSRGSYNGNYDSSNQGYYQGQQPVTQQGCSARSDYNNGSQSTNGYRQSNPNQQNQQNQYQNDAPNPEQLESYRQNPTRYFFSDNSKSNNNPSQDPSSNNGQGNGNRNGNNGKAANGKVLTDETLRSQLNDQTKAMYDSMSPEGKALALKLANQSCKGMNDCKGMGSCKAEDHSCAGKNSCAGTSNGPFKDKNTAVKVAAQKMAEKRASMINK